MSELVDVEYSHELESFVAVFEDGEIVPLHADTLIAARAEAERIVTYG